MKSIPVDKVYTFEYSKLDPHQLWRAVPDDMMAVYVPINHPVVAENQQFNPWRLLSQIAVEEDFVIIKLDIGTLLLAFLLF